MAGNFKKVRKSEHRYRVNIYGMTREGWRKFSAVWPALAKA
jgi:hypothetical protein